MREYVPPPRSAQRTLPAPPPVVVRLPAPTSGDVPQVASDTRDDLSISAAAATADTAEGPHAAVDVSDVTTTDFHQRPYGLTRDFSVAVTYRDWHVASPLVWGRHLDILHEPNVFAQFSFDTPGVDPATAGPLHNALFGASVSLLNYHLFSLHGQDLLEVSLDATGGAQFGREGNAAIAQLGPTAQLHLPTILPQIFGPGAETLLTANLSGQATIPFGATPPGAEPQHAGFQFGSFSLGLKVQY